MLRCVIQGCKCELQTTSSQEHGMKKIVGLLSILALAGMHSEVTEARPNSYSYRYSNSSSPCRAIYHIVPGGESTYFSYPSSTYVHPRRYRRYRRYTSPITIPAVPRDRTPDIPSIPRPPINTTPNFTPSGQPRPPINPKPNYNP